MDSDKKRQPSSTPEKFQPQSPQKYGEAGYTELSYTPSKLADNILYREAVTHRKLEEGNSKFREVEALNRHLEDRLEQVKEERDCIEESLNSQIQMYKKQIQDKDKKTEARIKEIQAEFKEEIENLIAEKEQQAKYSQSQKELFQARIEQLEDILNELKNKLQKKSGDYDEMKNAKEKRDLQYEQLHQKFVANEEKMKKDAEQAKEQYEKLSRKLYNAEVDFKNDLENAMHKKDKEIQNIQRQHRSELQKFQSNRTNENMMKNQQIKDLTSTFEGETQRLQEIINMKDKMIENLNKDLNAEKQKVLDLTKNYENQINNLAHDKAKLFNEVDELSKENTALNIKLKDDRLLFEHDRADLHAVIQKLKSDIELHQINFIREKDRNSLMAGDFEKELLHLRTSNANCANLVTQNEILTREVRNLRELLLESSQEMQKCKEEFLKMGRERQLLLLKIREIGGQCQILNKIKQEREDEARSWRETYYMSKPNHY